MAINYHLKKKINKVVWKSGYFYTFRYSNWHHDPQPLIIVLGITSGVWDSTQHSHEYISAINLNYVPRKDRRKFVDIWKKEMQKNKGDVELTWDVVESQFPYLAHAVRRYWWKPRYMIQNPKPIPMENIEEAVVSSFSKDFSKKLKTDLAKKFKRVQKKKKKTGGFMSRFMEAAFG